MKKRVLHKKGQIKTVSPDRFTKINLQLPEPSSVAVFDKFGQETADPLPSSTNLSFSHMSFSISRSLSLSLCLPHHSSFLFFFWSCHPQSLILYSQTYSSFSWLLIDDGVEHRNVFKSNYYLYHWICLTINKIGYYHHLLVSFEKLLSLRLSDPFALIMGCINND